MLEVDPDVIAPDVLISRVRQRLGKETQTVALEPLKDAKVLVDDAQHLQSRWAVGDAGPLSSHRPVLGRGIVFAKKVIRKLVRWYVEPNWARQSDFNQHATRAITNLARFNAQLASDFQHAQQEVERLGRMVEAMREENAKLRDVMTERGLVFPELASKSEAIDYVAFEDAFRGSREGVKAHFLPFVERLTRGAVPEAPVLDIGCGRGEMLELLAERGVRVQGIDLNPDMVAYCQAKGLPAQHAEALSYLTSLPDASLAGIFMSQVIEHLDTPAWMTFVDLAHRKLRPGGTLLMETINPGSYYALAHAFFKDVTHVRPIHPETLQFVVKAKGFQEVEVLMLSQHPAMEQLDGKDELTRAVAEVVLGHMDYAVVATR